MQHLDEGTIHAWLDGGGALDAEESARVEQHVAECPACAQAVAEARGLVAGASRILAALDDVPSGVVPRSGGSLGGGGPAAPRRPRAVWTYLHLTPARAAAAAFLIVAAGTALVMRQASEVAHRGVYSTVEGPTIAVKSPVPATPLPPSPTIADSMSVGRAAKTAGGVAGRRQDAAFSGVIKEAAPARLPMAAAPAPVARNDVEEKRRGPALSQVSVTASADSVGVRDSVARSRLVAASHERLDSMLRGRPKAAALNEAVTVTSVVGGAAQVPAPSAAQSLASVRRPVSYAGCYSVAASDSALPRLLSLDTLRLANRYDLSAVPARFAVSAFTNSGARPIDSASWQPLGDGVRISFGRNPVNLRQAPDSTLSAAGVGGRGSAVTLQRVDCPPR